MSARTKLPAPGKDLVPVKIQLQQHQFSITRYGEIL